MMLALKVDAIPGRLNSAGLIINRAGIYYGQCSELCGVLHGFMPIGLIGVNLPHFLDWRVALNDLEIYDFKIFSIASPH